MVSQNSVLSTFRTIQNKTRTQLGSRGRQKQTQREQQDNKQFKRERIEWLFQDQLLNENTVGLILFCLMFLKGGQTYLATKSRITI